MYGGREGAYSLAFVLPCSFFFNLILKPDTFHNFCDAWLYMPPPGARSACKQTYDVGKQLTRPKSKSPPPLNMIRAKTSLSCQLYPSWHGHIYLLLSLLLQSLLCHKIKTARVCTECLSSQCDRQLSMHLALNYLGSNNK